MEQTQKSSGIPYTDSRAPETDITETPETAPHSQHTSIARKARKKKSSKLGRISSLPQIWVRLQLGAPPATTTRPALTSSIPHRFLRRKGQCGRAVDRWRGLDAGGARASGYGVAEASRSDGRAAKDRADLRVAVRGRPFCRAYCPHIRDEGQTGRRADTNKVLSTAWAGPEKVLGPARWGAANRGRLQISSCTRLALGG